MTGLIMCYGNLKIESCMFRAVMVIQFLVRNAEHQEFSKTPTALSLFLSISALAHTGAWTKPRVPKERKKKRRVKSNVNGNLVCIRRKWGGLWEHDRSNDTYKKTKKKSSRRFLFSKKGECREKERKRFLLQAIFRPHNFKIRIRTGVSTSKWHTMVREIITGCSLSATFFALAMNMIIKSEKECRGSVTKTSQATTNQSQWHDN